MIISRLIVRLNVIYIRFSNEMGGGGVMNLVYGSLFSSYMAILVFLQCSDE